MPLDCVTYLGMLPLSNRSFTNPEDINPNDPNYALLLEKCLSNGKIVFELGVENNVRLFTIEIFVNLIMYCYVGES